jgi:hypothetical protein
MMQVGTVFTWRKFPYQRFGALLKDRWFIYIGHVSSFDAEVSHLIVTTTTNLNSYLYGARKSHSYMEFSPSSSPFNRACILDFDQPGYVIEQDETNQSEIEIKGVLTRQMLRQVLNGIKGSKMFSKREQKDIEKCFREAGVS